MGGPSGAGEIYPGVSVDPAIVHGKPVITGTRVPVAVILHQLAGRETIESVCENYDLTAEQAHAAIGYGANLVTGEEVYVTSHQ